tara:strand:- start:374 stop:1042 length:669 start_codon:yes stop_codon:yes gene_type:complete
MPQRISKKILIYLFVFLILGTFNNKNFLEFNSIINQDFEIDDLSEFSDDKIINDLSKLKNHNLFFLEKEKVLNVINSHKIIEKFYVFKKYPSNLKIKIEKAKLLAVTKKDGLNFYIGSNGNLIQSNQISSLPFIFGDVDVIEFLKLKNVIDNSSFNYDDIKNLYYFKSKRWDIETKNSLIIKLPSEKLEKSFQIISKIFYNKEFNNSNIIDLRQNNQVILDG